MSIHTSSLSSHFSQKSRAFLRTRALYLSFSVGSHVILQSSDCQRRGYLIDFQKVNTKHEKAKRVFVGFEDLRGLPLQTVLWPKAVYACSVVTLLCLHLLTVLF